MKNMNSFYNSLFFCLLLANFLLHTATAQTANKKLIQRLNRIQRNWKAGVNHVRFPKKFGRRVHHKKIVRPDPEQVDEEGWKTRFFDARTHWPQCESVLFRIRDQGFCSSGWAVAAASMLSDRLCIQTNGSMKYHFSAHELMSCCERCRLDDKEPPCEGGKSYEGINYFTSRGLITGGEVGSDEGCKPYGKKFYDGFNEKCETTCTNHKYIKVDEFDNNVSNDSAYKVNEDEPSIRKEIYTKGPVTAEIIVYEDLLFYRSGVYQHSLGILLGFHTVKIVGWGDRGGQRYWLVVNSHGKRYGYNGTMRFLRGANNCGIEYWVLGVKDDLAPKNDVILPDIERQGGILTSGGNTIQPSFVTFMCISSVLKYFLSVIIQ